MSFKSVQRWKMTDGIWKVIQHRRGNARGAATATSFHGHWHDRHHQTVAISDVPQRCIFHLSLQSAFDMFYTHLHTQQIDSMFQ